MGDRTARTEAISGMVLFFIIVANAKAPHPLQEAKFNEGVMG